MGRRAWPAWSWPPPARPRRRPDSTVIPGAEFQNANNLLQRAFHANPNGATAQIVFVAPHGQKITAARYQPVISKVVSEAARSPQVADAATPSQNGEVSRDGSTAIANINYTVVSDSLTTRHHEHPAERGPAGPGRGPDGGDRR